LEPHKELSLTDEERPRLDGTAEGYFRAALAFAERHYGAELRAAASVRLADVTPEHFFREYAWVVHATGFSARAVGRMMPRLLEAYGPWDELARRGEEEALAAVLPVCNNPRKALAVRRTAGLMLGGAEGRGWAAFRDAELSSPEALQRLPWIGPVTRYHLARNVGLLECVKPDLHLARMAEHWGYPGCLEMCEDLRPEGMPLGIVDLVLWYAASTFGTSGIRKDGSR
jgi:hypothetical protein